MERSKRSKTAETHLEDRSDTERSDMSKASSMSISNASNSSGSFKKEYPTKRLIIFHNYSNEQDLPYHKKEPQRRQAGQWKPLPDRMDNTDQTEREESENSEVVQIFKTECMIGNLRIDNDDVILYQPIELHVPRGHKYRIDFITITTPSDVRKYPVVNDNFDGTLSVQYQPTELGLHKLNVTYTNQKIGHISFNVSTIETTKVIASGSGLICTRIDETASFDIKTTDAYIGTPLKVPVGRVSPPPSPLPTPPPPPPPKIRQSRCELSLDIPVYSSSIKADIVFAIDSSASVGEKVFKRQVVFASKIIQNLQIGPDNIHVSIITFASDVYKLFSLNRFYDKKIILKAIKKAVYVDGKTLTEDALRYIRQFSLSPSRGSRTDCRKLVIFLTDGASTNKLETRDEAEKLKQINNVKVIAIGVGENSDQDGLDALASTKKLVFRESLFDVLFRVLTEINKFSKVDRKDMWGIRISCLDKDDEEPEAICAIDYTSSMNLTTTITRPSGDKEQFIVGKVNNHEYCIKFSPIEAGIHKIEIKNHNIEIPGSPFQFMIDPADRNYEPLPIEQAPSLVSEPEQNPTVEPVVLTMDHNNANPYELKVLSRDRTAGNILVSIDGPSKASFTYDNQISGFSKASYKVTVPGIYTISVKCDGQDIKDSPFTVHVFPRCNYVHCEC